MAVRRGDGSARRFLSVAIAGVVLALVGVSRLETGRAFPHVLRSLWAVDLVLLLALAWVAVGALRGCRPALDRTALGVGVVLMSSNLVRLVAGAPSVELPVNQSGPQPAVAFCVHQLTGAISREAPVYLETEEFWPVVGAGITNELERAGAVVELGPRMAFHAAVDPGQMSDITAANGELLVVDESGLATIDDRPGWRVVALCDPLSKAERAELNEFPTLSDPSAAQNRRTIELHIRGARFALLVREA